MEISFCDNCGKRIVAAVVADATTPVDTTPVDTIPADTDPTDTDPADTASTESEGQRNRLCLACRPKLPEKSKQTSIISASPISTRKFTQAPRIKYSPRVNAITPDAKTAYTRVNKLLLQAIVASAILILLGIYVAFFMNGNSKKTGERPPKTTTKLPH